MIRRYILALESQVSVLKLKVFAVTLGGWLAFFLISAVSYFIFRNAQKIIARRLRQWSIFTKTDLDDFGVELIERTHPIFLLLLAIWIGSLALEPSAKFISALHIVIAVAFIFQCGLWGHHLIARLIEWFARKHQQDGGASTDAAIGIIRLLSRIALWSIIVLLILSSLHVDITTLVAGLGIGGVAVALAIQNILGDLFASLSILLDQPFANGHFIVFDNVAGTVQHIGLKTTRLQSLSGEEIVLANSELLKTRIHNYKKLFERRILFAFGVTYDTPYEKLAAIPGMVRGIIEGIAKTRFDRTHFKEYGDSSLNFEVVYYVLDPDYNLYMDIQQKINLDIYERFTREQINFAFPTRTLWVYQASPAQQAVSDGSSKSSGTPAA